MPFMGMFYTLFIMRFRFPGSNFHVRAFADVETVDNQYTVMDFGIEHPSGGIDRLAIGGSFYSAEKLIASLNDKATDRNEAVVS
jgi:hypothetical protein